MRRYRVWSVVACTAMCFSGTVQAGAVVKKESVSAASHQYVLKDPVSHDILTSEPYFLMDLSGKTKKAHQEGISDNQGRTAAVSGKFYDLNDPVAPIVLVRAEGNGTAVTLRNLNDASFAAIDPSKKHVPEGAPYVFFNAYNNQALCGFANKQGFTQAYFVNPNNAWNDKAGVFLLKDHAGQTPCASTRKALVQVFDGTDSDAFFQGLAYVKKHLVMEESTPKTLLNLHVNRLIESKNVQLNSANQNAISQAIALALSEKDDVKLNTIGYSLGFYRQNYKQALPLLDEALTIKPSDCYYLNSKGYLLMRMGDLVTSREYLQQADSACKAAAASGSSLRDTDPYALAANDAHLAENYGLSGESEKANQYFKLALSRKSVRAYAEITEVGVHLTKTKMLDDSNQSMFRAYLNYLASAPIVSERPLPKATPKHKKPQP